MVIVLFKKLFTLFISSIYSGIAVSAACCGGGSSGSFIITDNSRYELRLTTGHSTVVAEKFESDKVLLWDTQRKQRSTTITPSIGLSLSERWQAGLSFDILSKDYRFEQGNKEKSSRLGDTRILVAYELIPPSPSFTKTPQVILSIEQSLLTGRGLIDSQKSGLSDVSGEEQSQLKIGVHLFKQLRILRLTSTANFSRLFDRNVGESRLEERHQLDLGFGVAYTPRSNWSLGSNIGAHFKQGRHIKKNRSALLAPSERYFEIAPYFSYALSPRFQTVITYLDQTLIGPVAYTTLSRSISLSLIFKELK